MAAAMQVSSKADNSNDLIFSHYVEKSVLYVESYDETKQYTDINEIIELYNVHEILSHKTLSPDLRAKYLSCIKDFIPKVARYFKNINAFG